MPDGRIEVGCLNGGAWDRSTHLDVADDYDAACALAEAKQAEWLKFRERPCTCLDADQILVIRQPQRPDEAPQQLAAFATVQAATDYLHATSRTNSRMSGRPRGKGTASSNRLRFVRLTTFTISELS